MPLAPFLHLAWSPRGRLDATAHDGAQTACHTQAPRRLVVTGPSVPRGSSYLAYGSSGVVAAANPLLFCRQMARASGDLFVARFGGIALVQRVNNDNASIEAWHTAAQAYQGPNTTVSISYVAHRLRCRARHVASSQSCEHP